MLIQDLEKLRAFWLLLIVLLTAFRTVFCWAWWSKRIARRPWWRLNTNSSQKPINHVCFFRIYQLFILYRTTSIIVNYYRRRFYDFFDNYWRWCPENSIKKFCRFSCISFMVSFFQKWRGFYQVSSNVAQIGILDYIPVFSLCVLKKNKLLI